MNRRFYFLLSVLLIVLNCTGSFAQKNFNQLTVNGATIGIENMILTDALGGNGKLQHSASFDIQLTNDNAAVKTVLDALQNAVPKIGIKAREVFTGSPFQLMFTTFNNSFVITDQKNYSGISVDEIKLPDLNATDQSVAKLSVRLHATTVNPAPAGTKASFTGNTRNSFVAISNFKVSMGTLPCARILKVSGTSEMPTGSTPQNFIIEMMGIDGAAWNQWFLTGAGGTKKEQGTIELLSRDLKVVLFTIQLTDVEIVSYTANNTGNTARVLVGLRARAVSIR